jgi:quinol monooxygenase YgiN
MIPNSCLFPDVGRPFANTICVILAIIRMKVRGEKRKELAQTILSLIGCLRTEKGCLRCDFYQSMENGNELCILEEWDSRKNLNSHLKSEHFHVVRGAMSLLQEPYEMVVHIRELRARNGAATCDRSKQISTGGFGIGFEPGLPSLTTSIFSIQYSTRKDKLWHQILE